MSSRTTRWLSRPFRFRFRVTPQSRGRCVRERRSRPVDVEALETRELLSGGNGAWSFASAPQLHPMQVSVLTRRPGTARGQIFVAPYVLTPGSAAGQNGPMIMDDAGNPIWFLPLAAPTIATDFKAQSLFGRPVLVWWQGTVGQGGIGDLPLGTSQPGSHFVVMNNHYQQIMTISAQNGFNTNLHDLRITPRGVAVLMGNKIVNADLTPYGGLKDGHFLDDEVQEIDLRTGKLIFAWDLAQHVPLSDSYLPPPTSPNLVWDPYHTNSIDVSPDGMQLLVSARVTSTVYDINQRTGQILWQLGGKHNQFHVAPALVTGPDASVFQYQHDARFVPGGISLFDNGGQIPGPNGGPFGPSRGMVFKIDTRTFTATLQRPLYSHTPDLFAGSQGDVEPLPNGNEFIGWGAALQAKGPVKSYLSEYSANGALLYDAVIASPGVSYRAFRIPWVGLPFTGPAMAVTQVGGQHTFYASWNGSTQTVAWRLLAGPNVRSLSPVAVIPRTGFETAIKTRAPGPYYRVQALGPGGGVLGMSAVMY